MRPLLGGAIRAGCPVVAFHLGVAMRGIRPNRPLKCAA
jgi:hypothetical protein